MALVRLGAKKAPPASYSREPDLDATGRWAQASFPARVVVIDSGGEHTEWANKWLSHAGLCPIVVSSGDDALSRSIASVPDLIIFEFDARMADGSTVQQALSANSMLAAVPTLILCPGTREAESALTAGAAAVLRRPFEWSLISLRAVALCNFTSLEHQVGEMRDELRQAQSIAHDARRHISTMGDTDSVTGLPKLGKFRDILTRAMYQSRELALFFIGIERFRLVNDAHGRDCGDQIMAEVGRRLRECLVRPELHAPGSQSILAAAVAKLDGVRFGLFVPHNGNAEHLQVIRNVLTDVVSQPYEINSETVYLSSSIGGAVSPYDGDTAAQLLKNAERAMLAVKKRGGGFGFHSHDDGPNSARQLQLDSWLREALDRRDIKVAYQPLVNLWNNKIVGAEALLRWETKDRGYISPVEFVPAAERNGMIVQLGDQVIDSACATLRSWLDAGHENMRMAINLSLTQMRRADVRASVQAAISRYDLRPGLLEFEISERGKIGNDQAILRQLHELKALGVRLSLDDFGTGDTAIEYLKRLPIDVLKLDRSYVAGALENGVDAVIAQALVGLAKNMNLTVIAEGVESQEQYELLRSWGCHLYQGFYCSPAVHAESFLELLAAQSATDSRNHNL